MNVLITGVCGFIFSNFYEYLRDKYPEYTVKGLDTYDYAANKQWGLKNRIPCINCADWGALETFFALENTEFDLVICAHSHTHNDRAIYDPFSFARNNVLGTVNVLEACRRYKIPKIIVISTDETLLHREPLLEKDLFLYDDVGNWRKGNNGFWFDRVVEEEFKDSRFNPASAYSASKLCQEAFVEGFRKTHKMDITIIRPSNIYGPRQYPEKLIPVAISKALRDEPIPVYGQGLQWRDYNYVSDFCAALDLIIHDPNPKNLYHVAANDERRNIDTVKTILTLMNKPESLIEYVDDRPAHDFSYSLESTRVRNLGWKPQVSFEQGLLNTIQWYAKE